MAQIDYVPINDEKPKVVVDAATTERNAAARDAARAAGRMPPSLSTAEDRALDQRDIALGKNPGDYYLLTTSGERKAREDKARAEANPPREPTPYQPADNAPKITDLSDDSFSSRKNLADLAGPSEPEKPFLPSSDAAFSEYPSGISSLGTLGSLNGSIDGSLGSLGSIGSLDSLGLPEIGPGSVADSVELAIPGAGDFGLASLAGKAEEMVGGLFSAGKDVIGKFSGLFSGDKSKALGSIKDKLMPSAGSGASKLNYDNSSVSPSGLFVTIRSQQFPDEFVRFNATPVITEGREASYEEVGIVHHPGQILRYKSSGVRTWGVSARLISRTPREATENLKSFNRIRGWVMPYYGYGTAATFPDKLGAPPDILLFSAYGTKMIPEHPTVLISYSTSFPNDIDYIQTDGTFGDVVPFPVIMTLELSLKEAWAPKEFSSFDLKAYKVGELKEAFSVKPGGGSSPTATGKAGGVAKAGGIENTEARMFGGKSSPGGGGIGALGGALQQAGKKLDVSVPNVLDGPLKSINGAIGGVTGIIGETTGAIGGVIGEVSGAISSTQNAINSGINAALGNVTSGVTSAINGVVKEGVSVVGNGFNYVKDKLTEEPYFPPDP